MNEDGRLFFICFIFYFYDWENKKYNRNNMVGKTTKNKLDKIGKSCPNIEKA